MTEVLIGVATVIECYNDSSQLIATNVQEFASVVFNQQAIDEKNNSANLLLGAVI